MSSLEIWIIPCFLIIALLYSSVGHAGASGYIAVMTLFNFAPDQIKPSALCLNLAVSIIATYKFYRTNNFSWRIFIPFAIGSVPAAFLGGFLKIDTYLMKMIIGIILLLSALLMLITKKDVAVRDMLPHPVFQVLIGAALGFIAGITGVGGGIFLSPILIFTRWTNLKTTAGVAAAFILVNSASGLAGHISSLQQVDTGSIVYWIPAVIIGGFIGAEMGTRKLSSIGIRIALSLVLIMAGIKMVMPEKNVVKKLPVDKTA